MHESGLIEAVLVGLGTELKQRALDPARDKANALAGDTLRHLLHLKTQVDESEPVVDIAEHVFHCDCGHQQVIAPDDLDGHLFTCPMCGRVHDFADAARSEVAVTTGDTAKVG